MNETCKELRETVRHLPRNSRLKGTLLRSTGENRVLIPMDKTIIHHDALLSLTIPCKMAINWARNKGTKQPDSRTWWHWWPEVTRRLFLCRTWSFLFAGFFALQKWWIFWIFPGKKSWTSQPGYDIHSSPWYRWPIEIDGLPIIW